MLKRKEQYPMNTNEEYNENLMKDYFNASAIEKAPAGFTEKVMTLVSLEPKHVKTRESLRTRYLIPLISGVVTLILTAAVLLLPAAGKDFTGMPLMNIVKNLSLPAVNFNIDSLFRFALPAYLPYIFFSILFLTLFDRGLSGLFHRGK
jgi:hypothetical protein